MDGVETKIMTAVIGDDVNPVVLCPTAARRLPVSGRLSRSFGQWLRPQRARLGGNAT